MSTALADPPRKSPPKKTKSQLASWADVVLQGGHVTTYEADWDQYIRFRDYFRKLGFGRVSYCDGILEIMSRSELHERVSRILSFIIQFYAHSEGIELDATGSATIGEMTKNAGKEPDESFWLTDSDAPDLAIEVVVTSEAIDKLSFYARFGIPEVWIWKNGAIDIHVLKKDGKGYKKSKSSHCFPDLDIALVERCTNFPKSSQGIAEFQKAIGD